MERPQLPLAASQQPGSTTMEGCMAAGNKLTVYNPMGFPPKVTHKPLAPRLDTLDGKTVYLVDCRFDDSDIFLQQMQAWFADNLPSVKTVFKQISSVYTRSEERRVGKE